jgi:hypothetical protein
VQLAVGREEKTEATMENGVVGPSNTKEGRRLSERV